MSSLDNFFRENHILIIIDTAVVNRATYLNLSHCEISQIPSQLLSCKSLNKLYLNNNKLKDLPDEICNWEKLKLLAMDYNLLSSIPPTIGRLQNLVCLNLSYNNLGRLIPEIGLLTKLEVLWLNHTQLESIPSEIGKCIEMDTFGARGNFIRELPPEIGKWQRLRWMTLEGNLLSSLPEEFDGLKRLIHLNLSNNRFDKMPKLHNLQELQFVYLSQNIITELDVDYVEKLQFIKKINLHDNPFTDTNPYKCIKNIIFDEDVPMQNTQQQDETDSEDWEDSAPSSELDISDSSEEDVPFEVLASTLPKVAKFTVTGY